MLYAVNRYGQRVRAEPDMKEAYCPACGAPCVPKCGLIKVWHWAHVSGKECDPWFEGETDWHLRWKDLVKPEFCEVPIGSHRADIKVGELVIELQHSSISPQEIQEREKFYRHMIWLFDASEIKENFQVYKHENYFTFRWKWPRRSLSFCQKPIYLDFGDMTMFLIKRLYESGGWGYSLHEFIFVKRFLKDCLNDSIALEVLKENWLTSFPY